MLTNASTFAYLKQGRELGCGRVPCGHLDTHGSGNSYRVYIWPWGPWRPYRVVRVPWGPWGRVMGMDGLPWGGMVFVEFMHGVGQIL